MKWRPIAKLTEADYEKGVNEDRLVVWNSCNGPHVWFFCAGETSAAAIKEEGAWEMFLILPPQPSRDPHPASKP